MASTSTTGPIEEARQYLVRSDLCFSKNNSKVQRVEHNDPTNKRGYTFLGFCKDDIWTARKCKAVYEHLDHEGYNWYALLHNQINGRPYLERRVPQVDPYDTQRDKYDISIPKAKPEPEEGISFLELKQGDKGKQPEHQVDYDSDSTNHKPTKEHHSTDNELTKETTLNVSII